MKAGDICRCISDFSGMLPEEITVYKNDIVQIHEVVDRHWLKVEGGGAIGRIPSSCVVNTELPFDPQGHPVFVAAAEFLPLQAGDLAFNRGDFIIGLNPVDDSWWCGKTRGKTGIFPRNFVWEVNKHLIQEENTQEKSVNMRARVTMSIIAQLPEELDLYAGDTINITHIIDNDWYRGESNGATGIFPSAFVEIVENSYEVPSTSPPSKETPSVKNTDIAYDYMTEKENSIKTTHTYPSDTSVDHKYNIENIAPSSNDPPAVFSRTSTHWKTIDTRDDNDIFDDDYFKVNMPGRFAASSSVSHQSTLNSASNSHSVIPPLSQASASDSFTNPNLRYENITESVSSGNNFLDSAQQKHRYENVAKENNDYTIVDKCNTTEVSPTSELSTFVSELPSCALPNPEGENDNVLNSLSQKVNDYLSEIYSKDCETNNRNVIENNNNLVKQISNMSSPGYNEDNTGIQPYGRAVFSFKAQYPNELTFKKGDIIHLLKHVDSHWTLGCVGNYKGIFPSSYVDIIVDCLMNEEEIFLARSEDHSLHSSYLGLAKAEYSFDGEKSGDVSMSKGDILKVIKYVDDNWIIAENMKGSKGMCPKNYISMLVGVENEPANDALDFKGLDLQMSKSLTSPHSPVPEELSTRESRNLIQNDSSARSRSSSPYNTVGSRRSYCKEDFGAIKKQEVDTILAKNVALLDIACKNSQGNKKETEGVFIENVGDDQIVTPTIPPRLNRTLSKGTVDKKDLDSIRIEQPANTLKPKPAVAPRNVSLVPPIPPRTSIGYSNSVKRICSYKSQNITNNTKLEEAPSSSTQNDVCSPIKSSSNVESSSEDAIYATVNKNKTLIGKPSQKGKLQLRISRKESASLTRGDSAGSASFPDDVSSVSVKNEEITSETKDGGTSPAILPQRPAPPPPPRTSESEYDEVEEYYSLPPEGECEIDTIKDNNEILRHEHSMNYTESANHPSVIKSPSASEKIQRNPSTEEVSNQSESMDTDVETTTLDTAAAATKTNMRRELMQEIVTTEHEYIHDLEALQQVISLAPSQTESRAVDIESLMGNLSEVILISKKLRSQLHTVAYESDENLRIGQVFLVLAQELCEVYKTYCSNHNVSAEPLLNKYKEEPVASAFLQWVLKELQQHKIQLLDMRSVLIKPVQRVLKYPLFLDRLVSETPPSHPDYHDVREAKTKMANVAKEINEYTKRLDLINKYRNAVDTTLHGKMQRVSMHSVAKKSARLSAIVSDYLGLTTTTKDSEFDEEESKFRCVQRAAITAVQDATMLLQNIHARHKAEIEITKALDTILIEHSKAKEMDAIRNVGLDTYNRLLQMFENFVNKRIIQPATQLVSLCEVPERLIVKRYHKLLDYDKAQYRLDRNKDPSRNRILEEELSQAKGTYEALNMQLKMELPILTTAGTDMLNLSIRSLVAARMYLQGHLAKLYLQLAQIPGLSDDTDDMLAQFRVKYLQQIGEFRHLQFIPPDSFQRTLPRPRHRTRKSLDNSVVKKDAPEKKKVLGKYSADVIYVVTELHNPGEVMELNLYPGDHVALLKNKDPLGKSDRWFVDDGDNKGFVRASCLKPLHASSDTRTGGVTARPSSIDTAQPLQTQSNPPSSPRPSTLPRAAPTPPPLPEQPPRYEDIFPVPVTAAAPRRPNAVSNFNSDRRQAPPPRYSMGSNASVLPAQTPLPRKPGLPESTPSVNTERRNSGRGAHSVSENEYYMPPLDKQQSNEYNSPVSEESNIYEEIESPTEGSTDMKNTSDVVDSSPIYEAIGGDPEDENNLPEGECDEPQFYYALYNFGGSDCTQLNLKAGQVILVIQAKGSDWWFVEDRDGNQGYVPASYLSKYT